MDPRIKAKAIRSPRGAKGFPVYRPEHWAFADTGLYYGDILGGGPVSNGLLKGFAVISSDAGHAFDRSSPIGGATFGLDPQARRDYGYNAVAQLTPMAKALIHTYYGYFASGGPAGVGVAVGNAVRTSLIVVVSITLLTSLAIYGANGNFNLSG